MNSPQKYDPSPLIPDNLVFKDTCLVDAYFGSPQKDDEFDTLVVLQVEGWEKVG